MDVDFVRPLSLLEPFVSRDARWVFHPCRQTCFSRVFHCRQTSQTYFMCLSGESDPEYPSSSTAGGHSFPCLEGLCGSVDEEGHPRHLGFSYSIMGGILHSLESSWKWSSPPVWHLEDGHPKSGLCLHVSMMIPGRFIGAFLHLQEEFEST